MELCEGNPYETCSVHGGRTKEFYCADHEDFYCSICVFKLHKDCSSILAPDEVKTFISEFKGLMDSDVQQLQKEVAMLLNELMCAYDIVMSTKTKSDVAITTLRDSIDKQLNRLQKNTSTTMDFALKQELPKYRKEIENLRSIQNDLSASAGLFSTAGFSDQKDSKRTVEYMRSLISQKRRFEEIYTKLKMLGEKRAISKQIAFKVSVQVQEVLKTLSKLEQFGTISVRQMAESKTGTNVATFTTETHDANLEIKCNSNDISAKHTVNKLNSVAHQGEGENRMRMTTMESELGSKTNIADSGASGSQLYLAENQLKCTESYIGVDTMNASFVTIDDLQIHQIYDEDSRNENTKRNKIDSEIVAINSDANSEASEPVFYLGESRFERSELNWKGVHNEAMLVHVGKASTDGICADELISNVSDNTQVDEDGPKGCFGLRQKLYTIVGRGDRTVGNVNTKRSRSLPVFRNRTRRQNKEVVVIEDDGSVHILMTD